MTVVVFRLKAMLMGMHAQGVERFLTQGDSEDRHLVDLAPLFPGEDEPRDRAATVLLKNSAGALRIGELVDVIDVGEDRMLKMPPLVQMHMSRGIDSTVIYREDEPLMLLVDPEQVIRGEEEEKI